MDRKNGVSPGVGSYDPAAIRADRLTIILVLSGTSIVVLLCTWWLVAATQGLRDDGHRGDHQTDEEEDGEAEPKRRRDALRVMVRAAVWELSLHQIRWWLDFGTLLGLIREGDLILGDNDADVCVQLNNQGDERLLREILEDCVAQHEGFTLELERSALSSTESHPGLTRSHSHARCTGCGTAATSSMCTACGHNPSRWLVRWTTTPHRRTIRPSCWGPPVPIRTSTRCLLGHPSASGGNGEKHSS